MDTQAYFKEHFDQLQLDGKGNSLNTFREQAFDVFRRKGIPTTRNEEWKYTRISGLFNKDFQLSFHQPETITAADLDGIRLPGHEQANELVFINGIFSKKHSSIRSKQLTVLPLEEAASNEYKDIVARHFGHSSDYVKDGINALNTAMVHGGIFIHVKKEKVVEHPVYIYNITDARASIPVLSQPRSLVYLAEASQVQLVETYMTLGAGETFTNQVMEAVVETAARLEYYKIQNDTAGASQVSTTHIRQVGRSYVHTLVISLSGAIVRNNLNIIMEAAHSEAHLYGLYFPQGSTHIDNHTVVDNAAPGCLSNELYKGLLDGAATGVFNGKVFVRQPAQKTNAYQSNKNILLSEEASVNTKPQLEIFADDVKCSHGCTVGRLDDEALFYLQSRGISRKTAMSLLLQGFASDILDEIKLEAIRDHVHELISGRLEFEGS